MTTDLTQPTSPDAPPDARSQRLRSIVVCAVPGAGEDVVARALEARGLGTPRPWFDLRRVAPDLLARWDVTELDDYVAALHRHRSTADGIFGMVLHWHELRRLHRQVDGLRQPTAQRMLDIVEVLAPHPLFVRLRRRDHEAHVEALHAWEHPGAPAPGQATSARRTLSTRIDATETVWTQWFDAVGIAPSEVTYEDALDDPGAVGALVAAEVAAADAED